MKEAATTVVAPEAEPRRQTSVPTDRKLLPLMRIVPPDSGRWDGVTADRMTAGWYLNTWDVAEKSLPLAETEMGTERVDEASGVGVGGDVHSMDVGVAEDTVPNVVVSPNLHTEVFWTNSSVDVTVTTVPPAAGPTVGEREVRDSVVRYEKTTGSERKAQSDVEPE